jgi:4-amino-4-deoxy-L-arabinose transferase-like glycosyltransferase
MAPEVNAVRAVLLLLSGVAAVAAIWIGLLRQTSKPDWPLALFLSVVGAVIAHGTVGVVLAWLGRFSPEVIAIVVLGVSAVVLWRMRPLPRARWRHPTRYDVALALLLLGCTVIYFRPHEYVLGGSDAHTYMNIGASLSRTGEFVVHDEWAEFLRTYADVTLRQQPPHYLTRYLQFVGWYFSDQAPAQIIPQFFPFHPVLIALGLGVGGLPAGLLVTPLWGVLALAAVYFAARRWFGAPTGLLAAVLLAGTPTHIFFARYPTAEMLTLLLVFCGLLIFQVLWDDGRAGWLWGVLGGASLGAAFLTRLDMPVVIGLVLGALLAVRVTGLWSRSWTALALTLSLYLAAMVFDALAINWPYVWNTYGAVWRTFTRSPLISGLVLLGAAGVIGLGVLAVRYRPVRQRLPAIFAMQRLRWVAMIGIAALSGYAYFIRPIFEPVSWATSWPALTPFPVLNGENWVRLGWYLTPLGVLLATLGLMLIVKREALARLALFLGVGVLTTVQYVYNIFNTPYHIYAMRRYVPIVVPMLMIYAAYFIVRLGQARFRGARLAAAMLTVALLAGLLYQARFVLPQRDLFGAAAQLAALHDRLKPEAIVLIAEPGDSVFADTFGVPLYFAYGHAVATVRSDGPRAAEFLQALLARAKTAGQPLQLLAVEPILPTVRQALQLTPAAELDIRLPLLMNTFFEYPSVIQTMNYGIEIYDVAERVRTTAALTDSLSIDVGYMDAAYLRSGFYAKEPLPGLTARWTTQEAIVEVPLGAAQPVTVELRAMIYRPEGVPPAQVEVYLDGRLIGQFVPGEPWQTYAFSGEARPIDGMSAVSFKTRTFNPAALKINTDTRDLGFLLDSLTITPRRHLNNPSQ